MDETAKVAPKKKKPGEIKVKKKQTPGMIVLTVFFSILSVFYVMPVVLILMNSFKINLAITDKNFFDFPNEETLNGLDSYIKGFTFGDYPIGYSILWSFLITITSVVLILVCTSMCAWYITRSNTIICKIIYFLCIFSMVVPFQVVMATLSFTSDRLKLNTPWTLMFVYLGFGAGLAVFMFSGFVKSIPIEIEEAADVDGAGPLRTFFQVVLPIMKPTFISVAILETMWVWNDFLLPYQTLDIKKFKTIPIHIQYLNSGYGHQDTTTLMALIILSIIPIVVFYFACQKYIIEGVVAGAVKG